MGSRLLPLLALLGAAGLDSSEQEGSPTQRPSTAGTPEGLFPGTAQPPRHTWDPVADFPAPLPPSLATSLAGIEVGPGDTARAAAIPTPMEEGTGEERTQFLPRGAGRSECAEPPSACRSSTQPHPPAPSLAIPPLVLVQASMFPPVSSAAKDAAAAAAPTQDSGPPPPLPEGLSGTSAGEGATEPPRHLLLPGTREQAATQTSWAEGGPLGTGGAAAPGNETFSMTPAKDALVPTMEPSWPRGPGSLAPQENKAGLSTTETQGPPLVAASPWQPVTAAADPDSHRLPNSSEVSGQERAEAAVPTRLAPLLPHEWSTGPLLPGAEVLSQQAGGGEACVGANNIPGLHPGAGPTEPVGPFAPGTALSPSSAPRRSRVGLEHTEDITVPDRFGRSSPAASEPSPTAPAQSTEDAWETWPPSVGAPSLGADRMEGAPHSTTPSVSTNLGATLPQRLLDSQPHTPGTDDPPSASNAAPGLSLQTLPVGPDRLPAGSTEGTGALGAGQDPTVGTARLPSSPELPPGLGTMPIRAEVPREGPATATGGKWGPQETSASPLGTWAVKGGSPAPSSSEPPRLQPTWAGKGGFSSSTAASSLEGVAGPVEGIWEPTDSRKGPQRASALPTRQPTRGESSTNATLTQTGPPVKGGASVGTLTTIAEPPVGQTPERGVWAGHTPIPTGSRRGSEAPGLPTTEGGVLNSVPSEGPGTLQSKTAALSSLASETAAPMGKRGDPAVTHSPQAPTAGTRRWQGGEHPAGPTGSSAREEDPRLPDGSGPIQTITPSGPPGSGWHTWPPAPAPEPGSVQGGDPPVASTWLMPAVPEETATQLAPREGRTRSHQVFVVENQPPLFKAPFLRIPCELVLGMEGSRSVWTPQSPAYQGLLLSVNETVTPLLASLPGFQRLEVKTVRPGSVAVVLEFDALFLAEASGLWAALNQSWLAERLPPGLRVADARVLRSTVLESPLDLCALLFSCHSGYECVAGEDGNAVCTSVCHRDYCKNQGICTHATNHTPVCQCPVGSDFWFLGVRCDYKVTQQGLLGVACGLLLSLAVVGTAIAVLVVRRVRMLLLEARADQTKSSYRRFCRLDDVSAHYWSEPWLASASSLDNPAFSNSEELLHLQILDTTCCSCHDECMAPDSSCKQPQDPPYVGAAGRPSSCYNWEASSNSVNDPMIDSGKASEVSVSSWPMEPIQWSPFPVLQQARQQTHESQRPHSYCEGMELVSLERSWTA